MRMNRGENRGKNDVSEVEDLPNANDGPMEIEHERKCLDMINEAVEERKRMNAMPAADGRDEAPVGNDEDRWWENGTMEHQDEDESGEGNDYLEEEEWEARANDKELLDKVLQSKFLDNADYAQDSAARHNAAKVADGSSFPQTMKAGGVAEAGKMVSVRQATAISRAEESTRESEIADKGMRGSERTYRRKNVVRDVGAVDERGSEGRCCSFHSSSWASETPPQRERFE